MKRVSVMSFMVVFVFFIITAHAPSQTIPSFSRIDYAVEGYNNATIALGDFNNDAMIDVVALNSEKIIIFPGQAHGVFNDGSIKDYINDTTFFSVQAQIGHNIVTNDFNLDGNLDLFIGDYLSGGYLFLGDGHFGFKKQKVIDFGIHEALSGDFNNDAVPDIVTNVSMVNNIEVFLGKGDGTFNQESRKTPLIINGYPVEFAAAPDFNHDGNLDLVINRQCLIDEYGNYCDCGQQPIIPYPYKHAFIAAPYAYNNVLVMFGKGDGTFSETKIIYTRLPTGLSMAYVDDNNRDGNPDILIASNDKYMLLGDGMGNFNLVWEYKYADPEWGHNSYSFITDIDNDSVIDIVNVGKYFYSFTEDYINTISFFKGTGDGGFMNEVFGKFSGKPYDMNKIFSSDINQDGKIDFIIPYESNDILFSLYLNEGSASVTEKKDETGLPFRLYQNQPNPFNSSTVIPYELTDPGNVLLDVYDITGRHIRRLVAGELKAGTHKAFWDGTDKQGHAVASGIFFGVIRFGTNSMIQTRKMLLIR